MAAAPSLQNARQRSAKYGNGRKEAELKCPRSTYYSTSSASTQRRHPCMRTRPSISLLAACGGAVRPRSLHPYQRLSLPSLTLFVQLRENRLSRCSCFRAMKCNELYKYKCLLAPRRAAPPGGPHGHLWVPALTNNTEQREGPRTDKREAYIPEEHHKMDNNLSQGPRVKGLRSTKPPPPPRHSLSTNVRSERR